MVNYTSALLLRPLFVLSWLFKDLSDINAYYNGSIYSFISAFSPGNYQSPLFLIYSTESLYLGALIFKYILLLTFLFGFYTRISALGIILVQLLLVSNNQIASGSTLASIIA